MTTPQKEQITIAGKLTPELAAQMDLDEVYLAGTRYVGRCLRRRQRHVVTEIVHEGWLLLSTTQRWDPSKLPLEKWFVLVLRNLVNGFYRAGGGDGLDVETAAQYRNYDESERHIEAMPPDEVMVEREERAERKRLRPWHAAQVVGVETAVAHNEIATAILREWKSVGCNLKPQQLSERLGFSLYQIRKAKGVIQYQGERIRKAMEGTQS